MTPQKTSTPAQPRRRSMLFFGFFLLLVALVVLCAPFSARALNGAIARAAAPDKAAQRTLPPAPAGKSDTALPYETGPQAQVRNPSRSGGPDDYGYIYDDETEPGGPVFAWQPGSNRVADTAWVRVRNVLTTTALDDGVLTSTLPFNFSYYGTQYSQFHISTNGNINFGAPNDWFPSQSNACLPYNDPSGYVPLAMLAPEWVDWVVPSSTETGGVYTDVTGTAPNRVYIVEWRRVTNYNSPGGYATFEVLLGENGEIKFQYNELVGTRVSGADGVIGIQNAAGTIGLTYSCYSESVIQFRAIRFRLRQAAIFSPSSNQRGAAPGATIIYTQTLGNQTGQDNAFRIDLASGNTWTTTITPTHTSTITNGGSINVIVSVQIPATATIGSRDVSTVTVSSDLPSPGAFTAVAVFTSSVSSYGVDFAPANQTRAGPYGGVVTYTTRLTNTSPYINSFIINHTNNLWPTTVSTTTVQSLAPNASTLLNVYVTVPANTSLGDSDVVQITAQGQQPEPGRYFGVTVLTTTAGIWQSQSSMPVARSRGAGVLFPPNGRIYSLGGESFGGNSDIPVAEFDPVANTWVTRTMLPASASNAGAAVIGNAIYVPGGYNQSLGGAMTLLQAYYPLENRAEAISTDPLPARRMGAGVTALGSKLYVIGGSDNSLIGTATVFEYDPARPAGSRWQQKSSMHYPRLYLGAGALNGLIYAVGGMPGAPTDLNVLEVYNPATDSWSTRSPMSRGRAGLAIVGVDSSAPGCGGYLYALGGGWQNFTNTAERYNPATDSWQSLSNILSARRSLSAAYSPNSYSLVAFGGWSGQYEVLTEEVGCSGNFQPPTPTPAPTQCPAAFSDVHPTDYYYEAVCYLAMRSIISGYSDGTFRPGNNTTRGQLSKIIALAEGWTINTAGGPHFTDVGTDNAFYPYIETAYNHGIIAGYSDGTFRWGANVTRGQLCKIVVLAEGWALSTAGGPHFTDVPTSDPFYVYVETAFNHQIVSGYSDSTFRPGNSATRGQIAKIVFIAVTQP